MEVAQDDGGREGVTGPGGDEPVIDAVCELACCFCHCRKRSRPGGMSASFTASHMYSPSRSSVALLRRTEDIDGRSARAPWAVDDGDGATAPLSRCCAWVLLLSGGSTRALADLLESPSGTLTFCWVSAWLFRVPALPFSNEDAACDVTGDGGAATAALTVCAAVGGRCMTECAAGSAATPRLAEEDENDLVVLSDAENAAAKATTVCGRRLYSVGSRCCCCCCR